MIENLSYVEGRSRMCNIAIFQALQAYRTEKEEWKK